MCMKSSLCIAILNLCGISLVGVVGMNEYSPDFLLSLSLLNFPNLFPTTLPTVLVLPSDAFCL